MRGEPRCSSVPRHGRRSFGLLLIASAFLGLVAVASCDSADNATSRGSRIVSANEGDVRVLSIQDLWATDWPRRVILGIDTVLSPEAEEPALGRISAVAVGEDGRIAALDGMAGEAWVWEPADSAWVRVATAGEGPAELGSASGAWWAGDTLEIYDASRTRLLRLADGTTPVGTGIPLPGTREAGFLAAPYGNSEGFLAVFLNYPDMEQPEGVQRLNLTAVWVPVSAGDASVPDTLGTWPGRAWAVSPQGYGPLPFGPDTYIDANATGIVVADGAEPRTSVLALDGAVRARIRWDASSRPIGDDVTRFIERNLEQVPEEARAAARALMESLPYPQSLPYTGGVVMGEEEIWVEQWVGGEIELRGRALPESEWRVVGMGANPTVERLRIPAGVKPVEVLSPDSVVVLLRDDMDREGIGILLLGGDDGPINHS